MKCVMVIEKSLKAGLKANTAAALGISLAAKVEGLSGKDLRDSSGRIHSGITNLPVPVLSSEKEKLKEIYDRLLEKKDSDLLVIGFSDLAQKSLHYDDYEERLKEANSDSIEILGICLYGKKKKVNKITGNLRMMG